MSNENEKFGSADREPTADEEKAAEKTELDGDTAEHYEEMAKVGADAEGEGEIVPD